MASSANAVASWNPRPPAGASSRIQSNLPFACRSIAPKGPQANRFDLFAHRRGEQREADCDGCGVACSIGVFAAHHRRERQRRFVGHAEGNVQIAQPDIEVNRQTREPSRARQAAIPAQRDVFPVPPLSGDQRYDLSQRASPPQ